MNTRITLFSSRFFPSHLLKFAFIVWVICMGNPQAFAQQGVWQWATGMGSTFGERAKAVATDPEGNVYLAGQFNGTMNLPVGGSITPIGSYDVFLAKYSPEGQQLWVQVISGDGFDEVSGVGVDSTGHVFIGGYFQSSVLYAGSDTLYQMGSANLYVARYALDGTFSWATSIAASGSTRSASFAVGLDGRVLLTGLYLSNNLNFGGPNFHAPNGLGGAFIGCIDSTGAPLWGWGMDGNGNDRGQSVSFDGKGNACLSGNFASGTLPFPDNNILINPLGGSYTGFVAKFSPQGTYKWSRLVQTNILGTPLINQGGINGEIYLSASYQSETLRLDTFAIPNDGTLNIFLARTDSSGNFEWVNTLTGVGIENVSALAVDTLSQTLSVAGYFNGLHFQVGTQQLTLIDGNNSDIFVGKYLWNGDFVLAASAGGDEEDQATGVASFEGKTYVCGGFLGDTLYFGPLKLPNRNQLQEDIFLGAIGEFPLSISQLLSSSIRVYPNPHAGNFTVFLPEGIPTTLSVYDVSGRLLQSLETSDVETQVFISTPGLLLLRATNASGSWTTQVVGMP